MGRHAEPFLSWMRAVKGCGEFPPDPVKEEQRERVGRWWVPTVMQPEGSEGHAPCPGAEGGKSQTYTSRALCLFTALISSKVFSQTFYFVFLTVELEGSGVLVYKLPVC